MKCVCNINIYAHISWEEERTVLEEHVTFEFSSKLRKGKWVGKKCFTNMEIILFA